MVNPVPFLIADLLDKKDGSKSGPILRLLLAGRVGVLPTRRFDHGISI